MKWIFVRFVWTSPTSASLSYAGFTSPNRCMFKSWWINLHLPHLCVSLKLAGLVSFPLHDDAIRIHSPFFFGTWFGCFLFHGGFPPISHPKCWSFLVGGFSPWFLGKPTILGTPHLSTLRFNFFTKRCHSTHRPRRRGEALLKGQGWLLTPIFFFRRYWFFRCSWF